MQADVVRSEFDLALGLVEVPLTASHPQQPQPDIRHKIDPRQEVGHRPEGHRRDAADANLRPPAPLGPLQ